MQIEDKVRKILHAQMRGGASDFVIAGEIQSLNILINGHQIWLQNPFEEKRVHYILEVLLNKRGLRAVFDNDWKQKAKDILVAWFGADPDGNDDVNAAIEAFYSNLPAN